MRLNPNMQISAKREKPIVGLEIENGTVAATELSSGSSGVVRKTAAAPLPDGAFQDGEVVDADAVAAALKDLFAENKLSTRVRLGIANQRVVVRTLRLPVIDDPKELDAAVRFQAAEQVPMPLDQAVLDRVIGGTAASEDSAPRIDVMLVAARREMITASLRPLRAAGLQPDGIDLSAFALIRALGESALPENTADHGAAGATLFSNVGDTTNLAVARRRSCLFTRVAPVGLGSMAAELGVKTGLTPEHARMWLNHVGLLEDTAAIAGDPAVVAAARDALLAGAAALRGELRLSLDFYAAQEGAQPIDRVVLAGPGSAIPGFLEEVESGFGFSFELGRPSALAALDPASAARLTLPYGLALDS